MLANQCRLCSQEQISRDMQICFIYLLLCFIFQIECIDSLVIVKFAFLIPFNLNGRNMMDTTATISAAEVAPKIAKYICKLIKLIAAAISEGCLVVLERVLECV